MADSPLNAALRHFEATEANLNKTEKVLSEIEAAIPSGIAFGDNRVYEGNCRSLEAQLTQIFRKLKTLGFGYSSRQDAKRPSSEEKHNIPQRNSLPFIRPLRLGVFALSFNQLGVDSPQLAAPRCTRRMG